MRNAVQSSPAAPIWSLTSTIDTLESQGSNYCQQFLWWWICNVFSLGSIALNARRNTTGQTSSGLVFILILTFETFHILRSCVLQSELYKRMHGWSILVINHPRETELRKCFPVVQLCAQTSVAPSFFLTRTKKKSSIPAAELYLNQAIIIYWEGFWI